MNFKTQALSLCILGAFGLSAHAQLKNVKVSSKTNFETSTWMDDGAALPKAGAARSMALGKRAFYQGNKKVCVNNLSSAYGGAVSVRHWITILEYKCVLLENPTAGELSRLADRVRKNTNWLHSPYYGAELRPLYMEGLVRLAEKYAKSSRNQAWNIINEALSRNEWLSDVQKADLFRFAGEISFVDQNLVAAKDYFEKSLAAQSSQELQKRLDSIILAMKSGSRVKTLPTAPSFDQDAASKKESELYNRMVSAVQSKDYISAIEDGVSLLSTFPGGSKAQDTDSQISSLYLGLATGPQNTWDQLKKRVLNSMKKVGGDRLYEWARLSYNRGRYQEAYVLAEAAAEKLEGQRLEGDAIFLAGRSAQASGELKYAVKAFSRLNELHSGSSFIYESIFRLGITQFRRSQFDESAALFERLLSLKGSENYEYRALYWAWRSLQRLKLERAQEMSQRLIERYPLTLYGMIALAEQNQGKIELRTQKAKTVEVTLRLLKDQVQSWDRVPLLLKAGWFEEAQAELAQLPEPQTAEDNLVRARIFSNAQGYVKAISYLNRAMELNPEYAYQKEYLIWVFPDRFKNEINKWSQTRQLEPVWVKSLIRQESAFQLRAVSRSNALGLMQLIPPTAQEVAGDLKKTDLKLPDSMFEPGTNIEFGTYYFGRMLTQFNGQLPFALAAYNAGPTRLKRWLDSSGVELAESELWVDELPWSETSFYVKSILRNILIFQLLDKGQIQINAPIWKISENKN